MKNTPYILLVGGGSGGHVTPIISIALALRLGGVRLVWIGDRDWLDARAAWDHDIEYVCITTDKFRRYIHWRTLLTPFRIVYGLGQTLWYLVRYRPSYIFSKWGPVSVPVGLAAYLLRIPFALHESDSVPGLANRILGKFAHTVFLGFAQAGEYFQKEKVQVVGQIIQPCFLQGVGERTFPKDPTSVLVQCGSLGSTRVFEALVASLPDLWDLSFTVILGTLNTHFRASFERFSNVKVLDWADSKELSELMKTARIAIVRSGATTLTEMQIFGVRMIMIPYALASGDHQRVNALAWKAEFPEHILLPESEIESLWSILRSIILTENPPLGHLPPLEACEKITEHLLTQISKEF